MPNRGIKESICTSESLLALSAEAERLFYRLLVNCDDFGRMEAKTEIIRSKCFPMATDKIKISSIEKWLKELLNNEIIIIYLNNRKHFLQFINWEKHQRIRASKSKYPAADDEDSTLLSNDENHRQVTSNDGKCPRTRKTYTEQETKDTNNITPLYPPKPEKINYAEFVSLTAAEYAKLTAEFGEETVGKLVEILDNYKGSRGKRYISDYRAILSWVVRRYQEDNSKQAVKKTLAERSLEDLGKVCEEYDRENARKDNPQNGRQLSGPAEY